MADTLPIYPSDDLDQTGALLDAMGTLWSSTYDGIDLTQSYVQGIARLERQAFDDMQEVVAAISRQTAPVFHTELWQELILRKSGLNPQATLHYGQGARYGDGPLYGGPVAVSFFSFAIAANTRLIPLITNRLTTPSQMLFAGLDYAITQGLVVFRDNPFDNPKFAQRAVFDEAGNVADYEVSLWCYHSQLDRRTLYRQFGYQWGMEMPSSETYKKFLNALWDGAVRSPAAQDIFGAVAAALDVPVSLGNETVEMIETDSRGLLIVTDQQVYRFNKAAVPLVAVGDTVRAGMPLTDAVKFYEFNRGQLPADLLAIHLGTGFLVDGFYDGVTFPNKQVPVQVGSDGIFTTIRFELGGWPLDIEKFWEDFHARGVASGQTLAQLLDQRTTKVGEPRASNLPATINPLGFLCANVLRNNAFAIKLRIEALGAQAAPLVYLQTLRRLVPPHTTLLLIVELEAPPDAVTMESISESPDTFLANDPGEDDIPYSWITEEPGLYYVGGRCI